MRRADVAGSAAQERAEYAEEPPSGSTGGRSTNRPLVTFAILVVAMETVVFLVPLGRDLTPFALVLIPAAAGLLVSARSGGGAAVRNLIRRLGVWRVHPRWYAAAILIPVAEKIIVDATGLALGRTTPQLLLSALGVAALTLPLVVLVPGMLEELGWRGFAVQAAIDSGRSPIWATLVVGALFLLFHVPLYLPGHMYHGLPFWPLPLTLLSSAVFLTWIYLRTGSVLLAGLLHAAFNASTSLTWGLDATWVWQVRAIVLTVLAAALVASGGLRADRASGGEHATRREPGLSKSERR
jgi:membrane protease YdiL (CAAX protease family)